MAQLNNATAAFIGASVTLFLVIVFMILMVILVRQCLAFLAKRNAIRAQAEHHLQARRQFERQRRGSITEPVPATFDWHHSIRVAGTPPPSYTEAKQLPSFDEETVTPGKKKKGRRERRVGQDQVNGGPSEVIVTRNRTASEGDENAEESSNLEVDNSHQRRHTSPLPLAGREGETVSVRGGLSTAVELENERNSQMMTTEVPTVVQVAVDVEMDNDDSGSEQFGVVTSEVGVVEVNRSAHEHTMQTT